MCILEHCSSQAKACKSDAACVKTVTCAKKCAAGDDKCLTACEGTSPSAATNGLIACGRKNKCFANAMHMTVLDFDLELAEAAEVTADPRPFITLHGLGDACENAGMHQLTEQMAKSAGTYGTCIEFGAGGATFTTTIQTQIANACKAINADAKLAQGFNIVGLSQGNAVARGVIEQCDMPGAVYNYVSLGGMHMGTSAMPQCPSGAFCKVVNYFIGLGVYTSLAQDHIGPANYYKDPSKLNDYIDKCTWLPYSNNEITNAHNATYKKNFAALNGLTLVKFEADTVLSPPDTEWFGFWTDGSKKAITKYSDQPLYKEDWVGLRTLDERKAVAFVGQPGQHLNITQDLVDNTVVPALKNSLSGASFAAQPAAAALEVAFIGASPLASLMGAAASCHFEDPFQPAGCQAGEVNITVTGVTGSFCAPKCTNTACPTDTCPGTVAKPQCALQDSKGDKYCALVCDPNSNATSSCSSDEHMACQAISGTGVCTYYS